MRISDWSSYVCSSDLPDTSYPQEEASHESEDGDSALLRNVAAPSSESEAGVKPASNGTLRNPKQDRTVREVSIKEVRTAEPVRGAQNLRLPQRFGQLKQEQQRSEEHTSELQSLMRNSYAV